MGGGDKTKAETNENTHRGFPRGRGGMGVGGADALRDAVMQSWAGFLGRGGLRVGWLTMWGGGSISILLGFFAAVGGVFVLGVTGRWATALCFLSF